MDKERYKMITRQEAIKELHDYKLELEKEIVDITHKNKDADVDVSDLWKKIEIAIMSMLAIECQISIKANGDKECYICPNCKYEFPDIGGVLERYGKSEKYKHCPNCGQAIEYETGA